MRRKKATLRCLDSRALLAMAGLSALVGLEPSRARAEGSAQIGRISEGGNTGLIANAVLFVDVLAGEDTLNIAARGSGNVNVTVTPVNADGSLGVVTQHTLTAGNGLLTGATVPATLPNGGNVPLRVAVQPGRYQVVFGAAVEPFDLSVTTGAVAYAPGDVPANGGRLSSRDWRFFGDLPGGTETPMNADFYVRANVGNAYEYVWQLQFAGLLGGQMCLTANDLGLPGRFARSSQPFSALTELEGFDPNDRFGFCGELSKYDIYVNPPNNRKPEPPTPTLEFFGIGACGAIIEGTGGVFSFDSDLEGTYLIVIDVDKDGVFDAKAGDVAINGLANAGSNVVAWDGRDANGQVLPKGSDYAARLFLRLGEFHFTGSDIEALDPGVTVNRVAENGTTSQTLLYWDDEALRGDGSFNDAVLAPNPAWSTPNGTMSPHAWRGSQLPGGAFVFNGPGENSFMDTWVFGAQRTTDVVFDILGSDDDLDGDGLINGRECVIGSFVDNPDSDGDGIPDGQEDRFTSLNDPPVDTDGDGIPDVLDDDDDGDGIPTALENADPNGDDDVRDAQDTDGDGIPDYLDDDDDGDGVLTKDEGINPADPANSRDSDGDGIPDYLDDDDDGDGIPTKDELGDANNNGIPDYLEGPLDSDGDGVPDSVECPTGRNCPDTDGDGIPDYLDEDDDNDGVLTIDEDVDGDGDPRNDDTDGDGIPDYLDEDDDGDGLLTIDEDVDGDGDPRNDDTDGDGIPNYLDEDDDGDGVPTAKEVADGAVFGNDVDGDGKPNWLDTDADGDGVADGTEAAGDGDANANGIPDYLEPEFAALDTDGDGILDLIECPRGVECPDTDGDGIPDFEDPDDDGDGIPTAVEAPAGNPVNTDGDAYPDYLDPDDDNDTIPTKAEGADPNKDGKVNDALDSDGDGIPNYLDEDDDGDGVFTKYENPDPNGDGKVSDAQDTDGDGKPDYLDPDDDGDGLLTEDEHADPNGDGNPEDARDSDGDGKPDYLDADDDTAPLDTDGDGIPDAVECPSGKDCVDSDGDGIPDFEDPDDDNDGILTKFEDVDGNGTPTNDDTDGDGKPNYLDPDDDGDRVLTKDESPDPNGDGNPEDARDSDGDGTPDYLDPDDDGDGIRTRDEVGDPSNPRDTDGDGIPDYLDDTDDRDDGDEVIPQAALLQGGGFSCSVKGAGEGAAHTGWLLFGVAFGAALFTRRRKRAAATIAAASVGVTVAVSASAQAVAPGFALNRYNPSERGSDWFSGESLDLRGHGRVAAGLVFDWAYKPLVSYGANGEEIAAVIQNQLYGHVGIAVNLWDHLRLAASFPVLFYQNGDPVLFDGARYETRNGAEVGDLRLGADLRLLGEYGDPATLAVGAQVMLPTGDRGAYTSDGEVRFLPRAMLAGDVSILAYSAQVGLDYRALRVDYANSPFGTEMRFGGTLGLRLADKALLLGPELWGSTVISDHGEGFFAEKATPFEGIFGAHYFSGDWRFGAGVGPGFTRGLGSPAVRVLASIEWFPAMEAQGAKAPAAKDSDNDGIVDAEDACVDVPGVASSDPTKHGCPERRDTDKDGIYDDEDACVTEAGVASEDKEQHGCPADTDGDGIWDRDDACVNVPGPKDADPKKHGCPAPKDTDGDGILDPEDACPDKAGPANDDPQKNGCPRAAVSGERVVILDRIEFDVNKASIRSESEAILEAVRAVLQENPQIKKLRIEGHTDNRGTRALNVGLSQRRAASVVQWLVEHGIAQRRLVAQGFGPDKPIDDNDSDGGRQNNRRVEFHIVETSSPE